METFERIDFSGSGPTQCLDIVNQQGRLGLRCSRFGYILLVYIIRLGNISNHRSQVYPVILIE